MVTGDLGKVTLLCDKLRQRKHIFRTRLPIVLFLDAIYRADLCQIATVTGNLWIHSASSLKLYKAEGGGKKIKVEDTGAAEQRQLCQKKIKCNQSGQRISNHVPRVCAVISWEIFYAKKSWWVNQQAGKEQMVISYVSFASCERFHR